MRRAVLGLARPVQPASLCLRSPWPGVPGASSSLKPSYSGDRKAQLTSLHKQRACVLLLQGEGPWPRRHPLARTLLRSPPRPPRASKRPCSLERGGSICASDRVAGFILATQVWNREKQKAATSKQPIYITSRFPSPPRRHRLRGDQGVSPDRLGYCGRTSASAQRKYMFESPSEHVDCPRTFVGG